jgi:hypothetical protein
LLLLPLLLQQLLQADLAVLLVQQPVQHRHRQRLLLLLVLLPSLQLLAAGRSHAAHQELAAQLAVELQLLQLLLLHHL